MKSAPEHDERSEVDLKDPVSRPLKAYTFDPTQGRGLGNYMTVNVRYEPLEPGPVGKYLAVIDYDSSNKCYYRPIDTGRHSVRRRANHFDCIQTGRGDISLGKSLTG